jgi:hypothetical protein
VEPHHAEHAVAVLLEAVERALARRHLADSAYASPVMIAVMQAA